MSPKSSFAGTANDRNARTTFSTSEMTCNMRSIAKDEPSTCQAREVTSQRRIRLFLDSNVLTGGIVSSWGLDKAALSLCAARLCKLVLAEVVRDEVEENSLLHAERLPSLKADKLVEHYRRLVSL